MNNSIQMKVFENIFKPLLGKPCWQFQRGHGSFLITEFGKPHLRIRHPIKPSAKYPKVRKNLARRNIYIRGDWHLWIYLSNWEAYSNGKLLSSSSSDNQTIDNATNELDGQILTSIQIKKSEPRTIFEFDLGGSLEVSPLEDEELMDLWYLYDPTGYVLTLRSDGYYSYHPSNSTGEDFWQEIKDTLIKNEL